MSTGLADELKKLELISVDIIRDVLFPKASPSIPEGHQSISEMVNDEIQFLGISLTPIELVCMYTGLISIPKATEILKLLFQAGAKVRDDYGINSSPVHHLALLCMLEGVEDILDVLFQNGTRLDLVDYNGRNPLQLAAMLGNSRVKNWLEDRISASHV